MSNAMNWIYRLSCALGRCRRCRIYETSEGTGGKCQDCGRIHGWMTSAELRAVLATTDTERHDG